MGMLSGQTGKISLNGTSASVTIRDWSINTTAQIGAGVASNSGGMEFGIPGATDFTGSFSGYHASPLEVALPGTAYVFYGQTTTDEVVGGIIITSMTATCNIEAGSLVEWSATFASIGSSTAVYSANNTALTYANTLTSVTNTTTPTAYSGSVGKAAWNPIIGGALSGIADIAEVLSWTLTINNQPDAKASSSTGGVTKRIKGPYRGNTASVRLSQGAVKILDTNATRLTAGTVGALRLYPTATAYWDLRYANVVGHTINNNIETGEMVSVDVNFAYTGYATIGGNFTQGTIIAPDVDASPVTLWP